MSTVLDFFRQREPRFKDVSDEKLTTFIADKHPEFLRDQQFREQVETIRRPPSLALTPQFDGPAAMPAPTGTAAKLFDNEAMAANADVRAQKDAEQREAELQETLKYHPLYRATQTMARAGKVTLAAGADLATLYPGGPSPSMENLASYANRPASPMPVEEGLAELQVLGNGFWSGAGALGAKTSAALLQTAPALGATAGVAALGASPAAAAGLVFGAREEGFDPVGAAIAAGLPGVSKAGERAVAWGLEKLPTAKVVVEVLSKDPLRLKGKVVQRMGNIEISNDVFRKYLESGGGLLAANAYLNAMALPQLMELPARERHEAAIEMVASNLAMSLGGFTARKGTSLTLENMMPKLRAEWFKANERPGMPNARMQLPSEEGAPVPPASGPPGYNPFPPAATVAPRRGVEPGAPGPTAPPVAIVPVPPILSPPTVAESPRPAAPTENVPVAADPPTPAPEQSVQGGASVPASQPDSSLAPPTQEHPGNQVATWVAEQLRQGNTLTPAQVRNLGEPLGLDERQAGEWGELGATEVAREIAQQSDLTDREKFAALVSLYDRMPTNGERTIETKVSQQYSTPPPLAWVASVLADFAHGTAYGEPTAGHGMLMIGAPSGQVFANELDPNRNLRLQRFLKKGVAVEDATGPNLFNWFTGLKLDRIGQNPPFGSVLDPATNKPKEFPIINAATKAKTTTSIDLAIALNTFEAMTPAGKGFAIIGAKTGTPWGGTFGADAQRSDEYRRPVMMEFFERFNVVDWFTIGGDLYRKMGAAWPVDVIIVHGKGKTKSAKDGGVARPWVTPPRVIETWDELAKLIPEQANESITTGSRPGQAGGRPDGTHPSPPASRPAGPGTSPVPPERPQRPAGSGGSGGKPATPTTTGSNPTPPAPPVSPGDSSTGIGSGTPGTPKPVAQGGAKPGQPGTPPVGGTRPVAAGSGKTEPQQSGVKPSVPVEGLPSSLMVPYVGASKGPSLNLVAPRNIATQMLAAQRALEKDVGKDIDAYVAEKLGRDVKTLHTQLAGVQVDSTALAIRNIERGSALITAHETGVGKGRVVAALIEYALQRGMIPVFVTAKPNLFQDMVSRDLVALGNKDFVPFITNGKFEYEDGHGREVKGRATAAQRNAEMAEIIRTGNLPGGAKGVFTTFDQLKADKPQGWSETPKDKFKRQNAGRAKPDGSRWAMLRAIAPRAIFILDESHLAAGPASDLNLKFTEILPTARGMYYSSATFAKRPDNLGLYALGTLMRRTGLDHEAMTEALTRGGVPLQQALTSMLAESGELIRAQQDWGANATGPAVSMSFKSTASDAGQVAREIEAADTYTSFLRDLKALTSQINAVGAGLEDGENQVRADEETVKVEPLNFSSRLFNLSTQYLFALRADAVANETIAELNAGRKPFIHVHNTLEGPLLDLRARKLPLNFQGLLLREMQKMLKLTIRDPMAEGGKREVELQPEDLPDGGRFYRLVEAQIKGTDLSQFPISPIDYIKGKVKAAGWSIGEITARDGEVDDTGGEVTISKRDKQDRNKILGAYNNGQLDVLLINGSGGTGLSAHTDPKFKDQRQRSYIEGQPAPDINDEMQAMGRTMRSGQTSKPKYTFLTTALAAERRFATMLRGKMTSLNANTTAEGESGLTQQEGFAEDIFNEVGDNVVFRVMQANEDLANLMELGVSNEDAEVTDGFARQATGRFVFLPNEDAQRLWDEIIAEYQDEIQQLDEQGQNPLRATAEDLRARTLETQELVAATGDTVFDGAVTLEKAMVKPPKAPATHAEAVQRARDNLPATRQRVREWIDKSREAERVRIQVATDRGNTPEQIDRIRATMQRVRENVVEAARYLGDTYGVDVLGDGTSSFLGVAAEMKLADKAISDFASASRQQLVLTTNTFRGRFTIPLSKLFRAGDNPLLQALDEDAAAEQFDATAETNAERHIITGNLLRGWETADSATQGHGVGRPRVAIYTREDGSLNTGILMPPGWGPGSAATQEVIQRAPQFVQALSNGQRVRSLATSSVHPIVIEGMTVRVPSSGLARTLWGDPAFADFFREVPMQRAGAFEGRLRQDQVIPFFDFITGKGVRLVVQPEESAAMRGAGGGLAARGAFVSGASKAPGSVPATVQFGGMQHVRPLQMPELVRLTRELSGELPKLRKFPARGGAQTLGMFTDGMITLDPRIFKDPEVAAKVLAHEMGHLADYLPHDTLKRGNLLGHLLALRGYLRHTFGPLVNKDLKAELMAVTMWWRPYNPATDPKTYVQYRQSPEELYADALSVLFNAPHELETRAPKFYQAFWDNLGKRPGVEAALFAVQNLLNKGMLTTAKQREEGLEAAFAEGETRWKAAVAEREAAARSWDGWWTRLWQELYWNFYPLEQRAAKVEKSGRSLPMEQDPRKFLDDLGYRDVDVLRWGRHVFEKVVQPIEAAGLTLTDAGKFLFYQRILAGDRGGLANPGGITPDAARLGLLKMNLELGLDKMTLLRDAVRVFHDDVFKLAEQAVEVGAYNKSTFENVIKPNKDSYATFAVLDYLDDYIPASIKQQIGTLKDVANPFQATILKSIGLINLIAYQRAKNLTVEFLQRYFPDDIVPANTQHEPPARKGYGTFMRLENGRPTWYYTDSYIADAFEKTNPRQLWWLTRAADGIFRKIVYPLIITYNPAFLYFMSPLRDIQRTSRNLPGIRFSVGTLPLQYAAELRETSQRYGGQSGPLIREMEANLGLGTPFDQLTRQHRDDFMADLLKRMRVMPDHQIQGWYQSNIFKPVRKLLSALEWGGMTLDAVAKTASYRRLRKQGMHPRQAAYWVRNNAGLPNINKKGLLVRQVRALVPFWNVFTQAWRADLRNMSHPTTRGGWWFRYMMSNGLIRALLAVAATGALGAALKSLFDGIGEYDKTNYLSVPVGQSETGDYGSKTVYLRVPEDETARLIGGIISKGIRALGPDDVKLAGIFDFGMGQMPSMNPALTVPVKWSQFATGHNPADPLRGSPIIPNREWDAGGWDSLTPMAQWTIGQTGVPNFVKWDPRSETTWELSLSAIPGVNKFLKVSDQGYREQQRAGENETQSQTARQKLKLPDRVQSLEMEYWRLNRIRRESRTDAQTQRYADLQYWYARHYRPAWEGLQRALEDNTPTVAEQLRRQLDTDSALYYRAGQ